MIYEMQIITFNSRSQALYEQRLAAALPHREKLSRLGAAWRTDVGMLNQLILVWPYADVAERDAVKSAEPELADWPVQGDDCIIEMQSKIWIPAPISPPLEPAQLGNCYEIRTYQYPPGSIPKVIETWDEIAPERMKMSPLVGAWYSDIGPLNEWIHIWAYKDQGERERIRAAASKAGIWPPSVVDKRLNREPRAVTVRMQNMLVVPTPFSPLR